MPKPTELISHLLDLLKPAGDIRARAMFGGWGFYHEGRMFALSASETFYVKVDEITRAEFEGEGMRPFIYETEGGKRAVMSYCTVPADSLESSSLLCEWARKGMEAASGQRRRSGRQRARAAGLPTPAFDPGHPSE